MHNTWKRNCSVGMALLMGGSLLLGGCGSNGAQDAVETSAVVVDMKQAQTGKLTLQNSFVGTVSPQEMVYVIPFASGTVTDTYFEVGDQVNAGDVLFKIDDSAAKLQLEQAPFPQVDVVVGNVATGEAAKYLVENGADGVTFHFLNSSKIKNFT